MSSFKNKLMTAKFHQDQYVRFLFCKANKIVKTETLAIPIRSPVLGPLTKQRNSKFKSYKLEIFPHSDEKFHFYLENNFSFEVNAELHGSCLVLKLKNMLAFARVRARPAEEEN